jgi:hypothetical protein
MSGPMRWIKLGLVIDPSRQRAVGRTHATLPVAQHVKGDVFRIYHSARDEQGRSLATWVDLDITKPDRFLNAASAPLFPLGEPGFFDDSGAMPTWLASHDGADFLYYIGWNLSQGVPFRNSLGLAIRPHGEEHFRKYSAGPILDRSIHDPCMVASMSVNIGGGLWQMWYLSGLRWEATPDGPRHYYHIKHATSTDGIHWQRDGRVCIDFANAGEYAISTPCVLRQADRYIMWYSYRGQSYRIGYAESRDGLHWRRLDHLAGIDVSPTGWDSEMIEYPFVFNHKRRHYMLYNGNRYGASGMGLAVLAD